MVADKVIYIQNYVVFCVVCFLKKTYMPWLKGSRRVSVERDSLYVLTLKPLFNFGCEDDTDLGRFPSGTAIDPFSELLLLSSP